MTLAERIERLNGWYDERPDDWRFQTIVWPLVAIGAINMGLTIAIRFPFALLLLLAIIAVGCVRVPFVLGWITSKPASPKHDSAGTRFEIGSFSRVYNLNRWYDELPEFRRPWVIVAVLVIAGAINMMLTINHGFPFGLLFLLALLAVLIVRGPYAAGWLVAPPARQGQLAAESYPEQIARDEGSPDERLPIALDPTPSREPTA